MTHRVKVEFDNESDDELIYLQAEDLPLLGVLPVSVEDGRTAIYEFDDDVDARVIDEALEKSAWSNKGAYPVEPDDALEP